MHRITAHLIRCSAVLSCAFAAVTGMPVAAQDYPVRPIRLIIPYTPGGPADIVARLLAQRLGDALGASVVIDNRGGASGMIGSDAAAKAAPDGYTLLFGTIQTHGVNPALFAKMPYDPVKDFVAVAPATTFPFLLATTPSLPASSVADLIALARAQPGRLNYSSGGNGTGTHLAAELLKSMAQVDILHLPYKGGGDALTDVIAGRIQLTFVGVPAALPLMKAGKLKVLAISGTKRLPGLPHVPAVAETLPGFEVSSWNGFFAPAGTSSAVTNRLQAELARIGALPEVKERLASLGAESMTGSSEQFASYVRDEIAKWAKLVRSAGIKSD